MRVYARTIATPTSSSTRREAGAATPQAYVEPIRAVLGPNRNSNDAERSGGEGNESHVSCEFSNRAEVRPEGGAQRHAAGVPEAERSGVEGV
jgi:hypothetical protein